MTVRTKTATPTLVTVRIVDNILFLCAPTIDELPTDAAPIDAHLARPVPVLLTDGTTGNYQGAPVAGALRFLDWLLRTRPEADAPVAAIASLIVEAAELTTRGEVVPDRDHQGTWTWRPAPGLDAARRIDEAWSRAIDAVDDGDPDERLTAWFATTVADLATARLGTPNLPQIHPRLANRWADQASARASSGAKLRFHLDAPFKDGTASDGLAGIGMFVLKARLESLTDPSVVLSPADPDVASLLGATEQNVMRLLASEWDAARAWFDLLPVRPTDEYLLEIDDVAALLDALSALEGVGIETLLPSSLLAPTQLVKRVVVSGASAGLDASTMALTGEVLIDGEALTTQELARLARTKSELVSVRGRWVRIDEQTRQDAAAFVQRVTAGRTSPNEVLSIAASADEVDADETSGWLQKALAGEFHPSPAERVATPTSMTATLRHYQEDGLAWLSWLEANGLGGILADDMGVGKALSASTGVLTPKGWRPIGSLVVKDEVIGRDGTPYHVKGVYPQGVRPMFRVTFDDGTGVLADAEHRWAVQHVQNGHRRPDQWSVMSTAELLDDGITDAAGNHCWCIPMIEPAQFEPAELPIDPYLLGLLLGAGAIGHETVGFSTTDPELLAEVEARVPAGVVVKHVANCDYRLVGTGSPDTINPVTQQLRRLLLVGTTSHTKFVPDAYKFAPPGRRRELLRGLMDTDGAAGPHGTNEYHTVSPYLADDVAWLVESLGGTARRSVEPLPNGSSHRLYVKLRECPFQLSRKAKAWRKPTKYPPGRTIVAIESAGQDDAVCIAVDAPDSLYVVEHCIVTHNTAQILALVAHDKETKTSPTAPTLVVTPTSVASNWVRESAKFTPDLRVALHHGSSREDPTSYQDTADIVVTSYGVLRRDEQLQATNWHRVVLDEAQAIKNPATATARVARKLHADHRFAVTGTPVENHLGELWSLMSFANPGLLSTQARFKERYGPAANEPKLLESLRKRIAPFVLRRHKTDPGIADELPERIIVRDDCMLSHEQVGLYQAVVADMRADVEGTAGITRHGKVLAGITKLKQICNHPGSIIDGDRKKLAGRSGKLDRLVELVTEIIAEDEAVVVFSQYATFLRSIADHLRSELHVPVENLDGSMSRPARDVTLDRFADPDGPKILCVSLKAGGTGLNLVRANHVIHFDRWWNPAVEDQASDRVWRIGQTKTVVVHTLVCPGTLEERIADVLDQKRTLADAVVASSPERLISELDDRALQALVELDPDRAGGLT